MSMQSDHEFAPTQIAAADFPTAFRGYDQEAVRRYLTRLSAALEEKGGDALAALARTTTLDRIEELEEENDTLRAEVRDLELELVQRSVDGPGSARAKRGGGDTDDELSIDFDSEFDEHRAIELLGKETARVLESARSAAVDIVKKAERQAKTIEKDARSELSEARRNARRLMAEKQAEAEELVNKVAAEAEETADRLRTEADQHREIVLAESKKIMSDAEAQAEADEKWAQQRAEQIVADAEALRQQLLSELVVERTRIRADLEEMSTARDRLVMALVVARSELDDMSQRLDEVSALTAEAPGDADTAVAVDLHEAEAEAQVGELVAELDERLPEIKEKRAKPPSKRSSDSAVEERDDDDDEVVDLTDDDAGDGSDRSSEGRGRSGASSTPGGRPAGGGSAGKPSSSRSTRKTTRSRKRTRRRSEPGETATGNDASVAGSATAVAEPPADEAEQIATAGAPAEEPDRIEVDDAASGELDGAAADVDHGDAAAPADVDAGADSATESEAEPASDDDAADGTDVDDGAGSLIQGFNTIELTESELGLSSTGGEPADEADALELVITTVVSRQRGEHIEGNRGDLLIDEDYRGRLPSAIAARDAALESAGEFHRSVRRALNDDQSEVLDRLRAGRGAIEVSELPRFTDQIERYLTPLRDGLAPVALAGARAGGRREIPAGVLDNLAKQLAKYIVDKVRIPVIREVEHATDHDREKLFEPIRSIYRDFRNTGLLDLADDALYESFAIGLYGAIPDEAPVVWLLDPRHDPDPVCEINAGRSGVLKGQKFPSGHVRPLALPNCRCLVVPD
jgi:DivIVA domain-containing protein